MTVELEIGGALVVVDKGIAEVVKRLNECGFRTVSSCSGLREDHQTQTDGQIPYVDVVGRRLDLIEIAEASGWDWSLNGKASYSKDGRPISYVNYSSSKGRVYKMVAGRKGFRQTPSSKEEAIRYRLSVESTTLVLSKDELSTILAAENLVIPDEVIKNRIEALEKAISHQSIQR